MASIPSHRARKRFARLIGPALKDRAASTKDGILFPADISDNTTRRFFDGSDSFVYSYIKALPKDALFIDVGAGVGGTALTAALSLGPRGRVVALEPNPPNLRRIERALHLNPSLEPRISLLPCAAGRSAQTVGIKLGEDRHSGASSIDDSGSQVEMTTLDDVMEDLAALNARANAHVKIDTEGYELRVLEGSIRSLEIGAIQSLCIEIDDANLAHYGASAAAIYTLLGDYGFQSLGSLGPAHFDEIFFKEKNYSRGAD